MPTSPYMPFYVADFLGDTPHLTTEEIGAYVLLIAAYWQRGAPLSADSTRLANVARLPSERWASVEPTLRAFFEVGDGLWRHRRIERELAHYRQKSASAREAAKIGAQRRERSPSAQRPPSERAADAQRSPSQSESESNGTTTGARVSHDELARLLAEAGGNALSDPAGAAGLLNLAEPLSWLDRGADLRLDVLPTIRARCAKRRAGETIRTWTFFSDAVMEAKRRREMPAPPKRDGRRTRDVIRARMEHAS